MKAIFLFYLLLFSQVILIAQERDMSTTFKIDVQNLSLEETFSQLEKEYGLLFSFKETDLEDAFVSLKYETSELLDLVNEILVTTELGCEIVENKFVLISKRQEATISGRILDNERLPLIGASVVVGNNEKGTTSDLDGKFSLTHKFSKGQEVVISYLGYKSKSIEFSKLSEESFQSIVIESDENRMPTLFITDYITDGINLEDNGSSTVLELDKVGVLPGQSEPDILKTIQFLPGISSPSSRVGDLYIRGGTPDQNLILWEDIPIYHAAHYFGMISSLDPFNVESIEVYRGGFGAQYGGRVSGVIDITAPDERSSSPLVRAGANMTHAYINGLLTIGSNTTASYSLRRSYSEILETPTFKNITRFNQQGFIIGNQELSVLPDNIKVHNDFTFLDSQLKVATQLSDRDRLSGALLYMDNIFQDEIIDSNRQVGQRDSMELSNKGLSLSWERQWSDKFSSTIKTLATSYSYAYDYKLKELDQPIPRISGSKNNSIEDKQVSIHSTYRTESDDLLSIGYHLTNYDIGYDVQRKGIGKDVNDDDKIESSLHSLFISYYRPLKNKFGLNLGLRTSYYNYNSEVFLEPRSRVTYALSKYIDLSATYGRHHQFVSQVTEFRGNESGLNFPLWALAGNRDVQEADLYQTGLIYQKGTWLVDLQAYSKKVNGLSSKAYDLENLDTNQEVTGFSYSRGIDLLIKRRFGNITSWLSYSYSKSELDFGKKVSPPFPTDYDQRHVAQWSNQIKFDRLELALGIKYSSGLPYSIMTDYRLEQQNGMTPEDLQYRYIYDGINNNYLSSLQELNLSIKYALLEPDNKLQSFISFSVTNLLDRDNVYEENFYLDLSPMQMPQIDSKTKSNLRFTPNLSFWIEW